MSTEAIIQGAETFSAPGERAGVLLLHGYMSTVQQLRGWAQAFASAGYAVEAPLLPGHGTTAEECADTGWADYLRCARAAYKSLAARHRQVFVGGLCLGAELAGWLALEYPETTAGLLVLNAPFRAPGNSTPGIWQKMLEAGKRFFQWPAPPVLIADPDAEPLIYYDKIPMAPMVSIYEACEALWERLGEIRCPVLVFTSRLDENSMENSAPWFERVSGPSERIILERSNHVATLDYDSKILEASSLAFVQKIVAQPSPASTAPGGRSAAIAVRHLVKQYPRASARAVDDLSFTVEQGEIFGLLGPNGAGKTTTIGILTTQISPTSGQAEIMGIDTMSDPMSARQLISIVPQRANLDQSLYASEILTYHASYHGISRSEREARAATLLDEFGLDGRGRERVKSYSGGMTQRLMIARALMHNPAVLILDEPTNNLDPQTRLFLWERIRQLRQRGITILLTTHDMEEASRLCDRIAIMDHGKLLACDTPTRLESLIPGGTTLEVQVRQPALVGAASESSRLSSQLSSLPSVNKVDLLAPDDASQQIDLTTLRIYGNDVTALIPQVVQAVARTEHELCYLQAHRPSLEDVFIYLTGRNLRS